MTFSDYYGDYYPLLKKAEADLLELIGSYQVRKPPADYTSDLGADSGRDALDGSMGQQAVDSVDDSTIDSAADSIEDTQPIIYVKSRIKSPESMVEKLKRSGLATDADSAMRTMHDAVGIRIICSFLDNVYQVADWLGQQEGYEVVERKDYIAYPKPNGYRSLHLILRVKSKEEKQPQGEAAGFAAGENGGTESGEGKSAAITKDGGAATTGSGRLIKTDGLLVEVQLRTIAIDFWAALEHQMKYKHSISNERMIREELKHCADEIASVDMSMQTIRDAIREA